VGKVGKWDNEQILSRIAVGFIYWFTAPKLATPVLPYEKSPYENVEYSDIERHDKNYSARAHGFTAPLVMWEQLRYLYDQTRASVAIGKQDPDWWDKQVEKKLGDNWWDRSSSTLPYASDPKSIYKEIGCGSVMRAWPIGLVFKDDLEKAQDLAYQQSRITHRHISACVACVAMVTGMVHALVRPCKKPMEILDAMIAAAEKYQVEARRVNKTDSFDYLKAVRDAETVAEKVIAYRKLFIVGVDEGTRATVADLLRYVKLVIENSTEPACNPDAVLGTENGQGGGRSRTGALFGWVGDEAVAAAAYIFMRHATEKDGTWKGIQEAVYTVGDSDSIAALAGALLGAYRGSLELPEKEVAMLDKIENYTMLQFLAKTLDNIFAGTLTTVKQVEPIRLTPAPETWLANVYDPAQPGKPAGGSGASKKRLFSRVIDGYIDN